MFPRHYTVSDVPIKWTGPHTYIAGVGSCLEIGGTTSSEMRRRIIQKNKMYWLVTTSSWLCLLMLARVLIGVETNPPEAGEDTSPKHCQQSLSPSDVIHRHDVTTVLGVVPSHWRSNWIQLSHIKDRDSSSFQEYFVHQWFQLQPLDETFFKIPFYSF